MGRKRKIKFGTIAIFDVPESNIITINKPFLEHFADLVNSKIEFEDGGAVYHFRYKDKLTASEVYKALWEFKRKYIFSGNKTTEQYRTAIEKTLTGEHPADEFEAEFAGIINHQS